MKYLSYLSIVFLLLSCSSKQDANDFIPEDSKKLDEYANKALNEAQILLDSLEQTPILNTEI